MRGCLTAMHGGMPIVQEYTIGAAPHARRGISFRSSLAPVWCCSSRRTPDITPNIALWERILSATETALHSLSYVEWALPTKRPEQKTAE